MKKLVMIGLVVSIGFCSQVHAMHAIGSAFKRFKDRQLAGMGGAPAAIEDGGPSSIKMLRILESVLRDQYAGEPQIFGKVITEGEAELAKLLLATEVDVEDQDEAWDGEVKKESSAMLPLLIKHGQTLDTNKRYKWLNDAVQHKNTAAIDEIFNPGVAQMVEEEYAMLDRAVREVNLPMVKMLLAKSSLLVEEKNRRALDAAVEKGDQDVVGSFLSKKIIPLASFNKVVAEGNFEIISLFLQHKAPVRLSTFDVLHRAHFDRLKEDPFGASRFEVAQLLLGCGSPAVRTNAVYQQLFEYALESDDLEYVRAIAEAKIKINLKKNTLGIEALLRCAKLKDASMMRWLFEQGVDYYDVASQNVEEGDIQFVFEGKLSHVLMQKELGVGLANHDRDSLVALAKKMQCKPKLREFFREHDIVKDNGQVNKTLRRAIRNGEIALVEEALSVASAEELGERDYFDETVMTEVVVSHHPNAKDILSKLLNKGCGAMINGNLFVFAIQEEASFEMIKELFRECDASKKVDAIMQIKARCSSQEIQGVIQRAGVSFADKDGRNAHIESRSESLAELQNFALLVDMREYALWLSKKDIDCAQCGYEIKHVENLQYGNDDESCKHPICLACKEHHSKCPLCVGT